MECGKKLRGIDFHENGTKKIHFTCNKVFYYFTKKANQNSTCFCNFGKKAFLMEGKKYIFEFLCSLHGKGIMRKGDIEK